MIESLCICVCLCVHRHECQQILSQCQSAVKGGRAGGFNAFQVGGWGRLQCLLGRWVGLEALMQPDRWVGLGASMSSR